MPIDRNKVTVNVSNMKALASSDNLKAGTLLWNNTKGTRKIKVCFNNIPFKKSTITVYKIDENNSSYVDTSGTEEMMTIVVFKNVDTSTSFIKEITLPDSGIAYVEFTNITDLSNSLVVTDADKQSLSKCFIRYNRYFPDRNKLNYAELDRHTMIARLGMNGFEQARSEVGAVFDNTP